MRIELFKEFVTLAGAKNYSDAAAKLFISQSTLTRHIQELEEQLRTRLFDRDTHGVSITPQGASILDRARLLCSVYDGMVKEFAENAPERLIIGAPLSFEFYGDLLRLSIERTRQRCPGFTCRVVDMGTSPEPLAPFDRGCHLVVDWGPGRYSGGDYVNVPLCRRRIACWLSEQNPLADRSQISVADLNGLVFRPSTNDARYTYHMVVEALFHAHGVSPVIGEEADALYQLGPQDFALVFGGRPTPQFGFGAREVPLKEEAYETVVAAYRKNRASDCLRLFVEALQETARMLAE